jgi:hypothetical protein
VIARAGRVGRGLVERLLSRLLQLRIATTTIVVIELH